MKIPKCRPEVYRLAAEMIANGEFAYCCLAIRKAGDKLGLCASSISMHQAQFAVAFWPFASQYVNWTGGWTTPYKCPNHKVKDRAFWNRPRGPKRQLNRSLALLIMADMCEAEGERLNATSST